MIKFPPFLSISNDACSGSGFLIWINCSTQWFKQKTLLLLQDRAWLQLQFNLLSPLKSCVIKVFLQNETQKFQISLLWMPLQDDFSEDAELSSLVSIEPDRNCSQWLSSVSDKKEWAARIPESPGRPQMERWEEKKDGQGHLYCKTKRNAVKVCACPDTLHRS